jgi:chromosome segregation ATPase
VQTAGTPYAALHDIDANKPGGSIKIRVKTYAHSLKLHEEALEDTTKKKAELAQSLDRKRLELLRLKRDQLAARREQSPALEAQIEELAERLRRYEAPPRAPEPPKGLVSLKKKQADGSIVRL